MIDDIIKYDDPRFWPLYVASWEARNKQRVAEANRVKARYARTRRAIDAIWRDLQRCVHPHSEFERVIPVVEAGETVIESHDHVERCTRCRMAVGVVSL